MGGSVSTRRRASSGMSSFRSEPPALASSGDKSLPFQLGEAKLEPNDLRDAEGNTPMLLAAGLGGSRPTTERNRVTCIGPVQGACNRRPTLPAPGAGKVEVMRGLIEELAASTSATNEQGGSHVGPAVRFWYFLGQLVLPGRPSGVHASGSRGCARWAGAMARRYAGGDVRSSMQPCS